MEMELEKLETQEELHWKQRSRNNWLVAGIEIPHMSIISLIHEIKGTPSEDYEIKREVVFRPYEYG